MSEQNARMRPAPEFVPTGQDAGRMTPASRPSGDVLPQVGSAPTCGNLTDELNSWSVSDYLTQLQNAIHAAFKCEAEHVMTLPVSETLNGTAWDGNLEIFSLRNHKAKRCYAWGGPGDVSNRELTLVLELPPVRSPHSAVKMAMSKKAKERR